MLRAGLDEHVADGKGHGALFHCLRASIGSLAEDREQLAKIQVRCFESQQRRGAVERSLEGIIFRSRSSRRVPAIPN